MPSGIQVFAGPVTVANTVVMNNFRGGIVVRGIDAQNLLRVTVVDSRMEGNGAAYGSRYDAGLAVLAGALVTVKDTVAAGNFRGYSVWAERPGKPSEPRFRSRIRSRSAMSSVC